MIYLNWAFVLLFGNQVWVSCGLPCALLELEKMRTCGCKSCIQIQAMKKIAVLVVEREALERLPYLSSLRLDFVSVFSWNKV